ncbi:MAG TPA: ion channel [Bryobacteraceae bacterium]|jgi:inward rectifier potassium channel
MKKPGYDPGLTEKFAGPVDRIINPDGTFNIRRNGTTLRDFHPYLALINMSWPGFLGALFLGYLAVNIMFAALYFSLPAGEIHGGETTGHMSPFVQDFFFSADTLTTLGYGNISPVSVRANAIASFEAFLGVLGLAVATGLLFGRVARPSARIGFSDNMLISPYLNGSSLQFRVVNRRRNSIVELEARVMLMLVKDENGEARRSYEVLRLERDRVLFLPLTWTVVHPIDEDSPIWGKTTEELARMQAEILILIKGHDDTFNQTVFARRSYRHDEIVWGARFAPAFHAGPGGRLVLELRKVGELAGE